MRRIEKWVTSALIGERKRSQWESVLCWLLSQGYRVGVGLRNAIYDRGLIAACKLPNMQVISVGNIAACGMGKTPLVHKLIQELSLHLPVAIVSRGFRSQVEKEKTNAKVNLSEPLAAKLYGDEPVLLAKKGAVPVFVGIDRFVSGEIAAKEGIECIVLDDGMQYRKLHRDFDIAVIDPKDPFCRHRFLPAGFLRDEVRSLQRATHIVALSIANEAEYEEICQLLKNVSIAPVIGMNTCAQAPLLPYSRVGLFCGIGRPERFVKTVRDLKIEIVDTLYSSDHELPGHQELLQFALLCKAKGAQALVCTEKDLVKLPIDFALPLPLVPVGIELQVTAGKNHWDQFIQTVVGKRS